MERVDGYAPIETYAVIGDGRTTALVARDGSIDWLCVPDIDSTSVFGRILDADRGGSFELAPLVRFEAERRYQRDSNVLETTFHTARGAVRVTDAMTLTDTQTLSPLREIVRRVECLSGTVPMRWRMTPRFDYGRAQTRVELRRRAVFATWHREVAALETWDAGETQLVDGTAHAEWEMRSGDVALLDLCAAHEEPTVLPTRAGAERRLQRTIDFWPRWAATTGYDGRWRDEVVRSALVLKLLVYAPSGAIVAAPTTSLPEWLGGSRNWDYRFTWIRDASFTLDALLHLGYREEAHAFFWWVMHASRLTQPRLQILYCIDGGAKAYEIEARGLDGYRGSRPVRIGNAAADQVQLDVYGALLDAVFLFVESGARLDRATAKEIAQIADYIARTWREPDAGIWEVRSGPTHFTQSKALCWVALDRASRLAAAGRIPGKNVGVWRREAEAIRAFVDEHGWDEERGSYVRAPDRRELDASLLTLPILGFDDPRSSRAQQTVAAVRRELGRGPLVYRYRGEDGVGGDEGAFLTCSFWLVDALAQGGRLDEARQLMDELVALANDVGLYAEEVDPRDGAFLGNFPQGLTHLALVNAAVSIADAEEERP